MGHIPNNNTIPENFICENPVFLTDIRTSRMIKMLFDAVV
jgi:hypothetical protein